MTRSEAQSRVSYWAGQYGVPESLALAVAQQESGFIQDKRGYSGEVGVMQLMPATAVGLRVDSYDPEQNIEGGVRLLRDNYTRFGDWSLALSAYNGGPGNVAAYGGVAPKTAGYVASVMSQAGMLPGGAPPDVPSYQPTVEEAWNIAEEDRIPLLVVAGLAAVLLLGD